MDLIEPLIRRRRLVIALYALLVVAAAPGLLRLSYDNSAEAFSARGGDTLERYRRFEFDFGRDRAVRIVLRGDDLWSEESLGWISSLEAKAGALPGVIGAVGLPRHHRWRLPAWPPPDLRSLRAEAISDPLDLGLGWVSGDGKTLTLVALLYKLPALERREVLRALDELIERSPAGIEASLTGLPVVARALDRAMVEIATLFFPLLAFLALLVLALLFRHPGEVALPLVLVMVSQVVVFGLMGWARQALSLVMTVLVPLLFVIALATAVHVLMFYRTQCRPGSRPGEALSKTYRVKAWPVLWTGVTTSVGFGSLAVSSLPPVRSLGIWSAFAMAFLTLATFTLYPALLATLGDGNREHGGAGGGSLSRLSTFAAKNGGNLAAFAIRRRRIVFAVFVAVGLLAAAGLGRLRSESNTLTYFRQGHPLRSDIEALEAAGIGSVSAELVLSRDAGAAGFDSDRGIAELAALSSDLRAQPRVLGAVGAGDLFAAVSRYRSTESRLLEVIRGDPELSRMLAFFVTPKGDRARISIFLPMLDFQDAEPIFARALAAAAERFPEDESEITGQFPQTLAGLRGLMRTMVTSLALTVLLVALIFRLLLGSAFLALRVLVPNLWPVLFVVGTMGWLGVPIDSTTVMIAAAVLGLAVDDTLHTVGSFRRLVRDREAPIAAREALERLASAHIATALILIAGFGVCGFSGFLPVARFGALSALAILMALAADLLLTPALLAGATRAEIAGLVAGGQEEVPRRR